MTDQQRADKSEQSMKLVKKSIQSLEDSMKDKDDHIRLLELSVARLHWLCQQKTTYPEKKECKHTNSHWIGRPWSGVHQCEECYEEFPVSEEQKIKDIADSQINGESNLPIK